MISTLLTPWSASLERSRVSIGSDTSTAVTRAQPDATSTANCPMPAPNSTTSESHARPRLCRSATSLAALASSWAS